MSAPIDVFYNSWIKSVLVPSYQEVTAGRGEHMDRTKASPSVDERVSEG